MKKKLNKCKENNMLKYYSIILYFLDRYIRYSNKSNILLYYIL